MLKSAPNAIMQLHPLTFRFKSTSPWLDIKRCLLSVFLCALSSVVAFGDTSQQLWIDRAYGSTWDPIGILRSHPNLKTIYVPAFLWDPPIQNAVHLAQIADSVKILRSKGVRVIGVISPVLFGKYIPNTDEQDLTLNGVYRQGSPSIFAFNSESAVNRLLAKVRSVQSVAHFDGLLLNVTLPRSPLYGYNLQFREYMISKHHLDPVDYIYPLGLSPKVQPGSKNALLTIARERLLLLSQTIQRFTTLCKTEGISASVLSVASAYQYPYLTRAAWLADWVSWVTENEGLDVLLATYDDSLTDETCIDVASQLIKQNNLSNAHFSFLLRRGSKLADTNTPSFLLLNRVTVLEVHKNAQK